VTVNSRTCRCPAQAVNVAEPAFLSPSHRRILAVAAEPIGRPASVNICYSLAGGRAGTLLRA